MPKNPASPHATYSLLSDTDLHLVLETALEDPGLSADRRAGLLRALLLDCMASASAFRKFCSLKDPTTLSAADLQPLLSRAWASCPTAGSRGHLRAWLDLSDLNWPQLVGEEFYGALLHPQECQLVLTGSQERAWKVLEDMSDLVFSGVLERQQIRPRTSVLIAGPSGVGKTHLVEAYAKQNGLGFLRLTFGGWVVNGARSEPYTQETVQSFLCRHERSVICIDELDKLSAGHGGEWCTALYNELYALLDRSWFAGCGNRSPGPLQSLADRRLRESCLLVGTGTWQNLWEIRGGAKPAIGFAGPTVQSMDRKIRAAGVIPTELLNRFSEELVLLEPLGREDFESVLKLTGLDTLAEVVGVGIDLEEAIASGLGMRWVEGLARRIQVKRRATAREELRAAVQSGC